MKYTIIRMMMKLRSGYDNDYRKNIQQAAKNIVNNTTTLGIYSRIKTVKIVLPIVLILLSGTGVTASNQILQPAFAITFGSTRNLSNNDGDSLNPQVEVSSSNVYAVWEDK